jgi:hypothetical protein
MKDISPTKALQIALEKRVLNEFASKILNEEKMDKHIQDQRGSRLSHLSQVPFHCECDDETCTAYISLSTEEYLQVHSKTRNFIVVRQHVRLDIEEIISSFPGYAVVGKYFPHPKKI